MPRRGGGRQCEHVNPKTAIQCSAWAMRNTFESEDGPRCYLHQGTDLERSSRARRAASARTLKRRSQVEARPSSGLSPGITLEQVLRAVAPALTAVFEHNSKPDWSARLAAAGVLVSAFPAQYRRTAEDVRALLEKILPSHLATPELLEAERVYTAMRDEWRKLTGLGWSDLTGLFVKPYPSYMIAVWEDAAKIQRSRPAPIPPDRAPVRRFVDGSVALERPGLPPLLLQQLEEDGLLVEDAS